ncbi:hypothetical protein CHUUTOTORO_01430 [Serratia phage vB_SmaM-ChuuTotoro]|nr:hypothetical protein CHUUTOTORO_01430 [Serratia phage vB_SmaM-ChuuTotoro]
MSQHDQNIAVILPRDEYDRLTVANREDSWKSGYSIFSDGLPGAPGAVDWKMMSLHFSGLMISERVEISDDQLYRLLSKMIPKSYRAPWVFRADNEKHRHQIARCITGPFKGERDVSYHLVEKIIAVASKFGKDVELMVRDFFEDSTGVRWPDSRVCGKIDEAIATVTSDGVSSTFSLKRDDQEVTIMGRKNIKQIRDLLNDLLEQLP